MSKTYDARFDIQLRIASYRAITDLLVANGLITKQDEKRIRKHLSKMGNSLIRPESTVSTEHDREVTTIS